MPLHDDEPSLDEIALALGTRLEPLPAIQHALTHFDWALHPRRAKLSRKPAAALLGAGRWVERTELAAVALPAPLRRLLEDSAAG